MFHFCVSCNIWESVKLSRDNSSSVSANRGSRLWIWISLVLTVSLDLLSGVCSPTMTDGPWKMWGCRNGGICATGCVALYPKRICLGMRVWEAGAAVWAICFSSYSLTGFWKARSLNIKSTGSLLGALKIFAELHSQTLYTFVNSNSFPLFLCSEWDPGQSAVHTPFCKIAQSISHQPRELEETQGKTTFSPQSP